MSEIKNLNRSNSRQNTPRKTPSPACNTNSSADSYERRNTPDDEDDDDDDSSSSTMIVTNGRSSTPNSRFGVEPTYFIGGNNGTQIIEEILNSYGWRRIREKNDEHFKLKWVELKSAINYNAFREGEQLVNHIPNCELLTNKEGLLNSLQEYCKISAANHKQSVKMDFFPETYKVDDPKDKEKFLAIYQEDEIWICKPTGRNQGKGIFLIWNSEECHRAVTQETINNPIRFRPLNRIVQRYIANPLLINNRKFDIRCYMLIANTMPFIVLYHKGYIKLSMYDYDKNCDNILTHLTNQKKDPKYGERKEETVWSMDKFNDYVNRNFADSKKIGQNWVYNALTEKMKSIIMVCFNAVKNKLQRRLGYFELYGLDFLVDENMKVWLIEINMNPSFTINCQALKDVIPGLLKEAIDISVECFEKSRRRKQALPLMSVKQFELLYAPNMLNSTSGPSQNGFPKSSSRLSSNSTNRKDKAKMIPTISANSGKAKLGSADTGLNHLETAVGTRNREQKSNVIKNIDVNVTKQNNNESAIVLQNMLARQKQLQESMNKLKKIDSKKSSNSKISFRQDKPIVPPRPQPQNATSANPSRNPSVNKPQRPPPPLIRQRNVEDTKSKQSNIVNLITDHNSKSDNSKRTSLVDAKFSETKNLMPVNNKIESNLKTSTSNTIKTKEFVRKSPIIPTELTLDQLTKNNKLTSSRTQSLSIPKASTLPPSKPTSNSKVSNTTPAITQSKITSPQEKKSSSDQLKAPVTLDQLKNAKERLRKTQNIKAEKSESKTLPPKKIQRNVTVFQNPQMLDPFVHGLRDNSKTRSLSRTEKVPTKRKKSEDTKQASLVEPSSLSEKTNTKASPHINNISNSMTKFARQSSKTSQANPTKQKKSVISRNNLNVYDSSSLKSLHKLLSQTKDIDKNQRQKNDFVNVAKE